MVQVDVFWSYGIGSAFAFAAWRQLRKLKVENESRRWRLGWQDSLELTGAEEESKVTSTHLAKSGDPNHSEFREALKELRAKGFVKGAPSLKNFARLQRDLRRLRRAWMNDNADAFNNEYFVRNLFFLSLLFVPSGAVLLWSNPSWETMQAGSYETIPQWLVGIFTTTNMTQGILGFLVTYNLLMKGKLYDAALQTILAHTAFFFILINGWDKTGYQRFFSKDRESFENWKWTNAFSWLFSDVVRILSAYGTVFGPTMVGWMYNWVKEGKKLEAELQVAKSREEKRAENMRLVMDLQAMVFGVTFVNALVAHLLIRTLGWVPGGAAAATAIYLGTVSERGFVKPMVKRIMKVDTFEAPPVWELAAQDYLAELVGAEA